MLFTYKALDKEGNNTEGSIDAITLDVAITSLQRRGLTVSSVVPAKNSTSFFSRDIGFFDHVSTKDLVVLSRQMATLFEAQVSALRVFRLLASETENKMLGRALGDIADDLQAGSAISKALSKHEKIFSDFYVNMVRSGEETGKLDEVFLFLADSLDRNYAVDSKVKNALIYPAFVIFTFVTVMILMLTLVIPKISSIIKQSGQPIPVYTQFVLSLSSFFTSYWIFMLVVIVVGGYSLFRFLRTPLGKASFDEFKINAPFMKIIYQKLYLSRIADNMNTMLSSGIPMVRAIELTAGVVGNLVYRKILDEAAEDIKVGKSVSESLSGHHREIPGIMVQMIKIGEETGDLGKILKTLSLFYQREVTNAVDTLVGLIEPIMIVVLGVGVGFLLASVLIPIYNMSSSIS